MAYTNFSINEVQPNNMQYLMSFLGAGITLAPSYKFGNCCVIGGVGSQLSFFLLRVAPLVC